jgi:hypothetical protein
VQYAVMTEMKMAETADTPVMTRLEPIRRRVFTAALRYIFIIASPFTVSHSLITAIKPKGRKNRNGFRMVELESAFLPPPCKIGSNHDHQFFVFARGQMR